MESNQVDWQILSAGIVILLAIVAGIWRVARFRSDVLDQWRDRVSIAQAALSDRAMDELKKLRGQIDDLLLSGAQFHPRSVIADPGELVSAVNRFRKYIEARDNLQRRFRYLLRIGPLLLVCLPLLGIGTLLCFLYLSGYSQERVMWTSGLMVVGLSGSAGVGILIAYIYLQYQLSGAEMMASAELHEDVETQ